MARSAKFRLKGDDAALIMRGDGGIELMIPDGKPGDRVPDHIVLLMAIAERLEGDPTFCDQMIEHMKNVVAEPLGIARITAH